MENSSENTETKNLDESIVMENSQKKPDNDEAELAELLEKQKLLEEASKLGLQKELNDNDNDNDEAELAELLEKQKLLEEASKLQLQKELEEHIEDAKNNLNIFETWMAENFSSENLYKKFSDTFDTKYRSDLFENICEFFSDANFVTNDILFYFKYLVISLLITNKKYKYYLKKLQVNTENKETNLRLVREKYIFRCFIEDDHLCYFKENGNDYYVS